MISNYRYKQIIMILILFKQSSFILAKYII